MRKKQRNRILSILSLITMCAFLWLCDSNLILGAYEVRVLRLCGVYIIAALSLNLINGLTGQFSLGSAGFMAIGAYTTSLMILSPEAKETQYYVMDILPWVRDLQAPFIVALLIGGVFAALCAFLIGFPVLRLKSDYLAIATLGFSEIIRILIMNATPITNSSAGIKGIPDTANLWWTSITAGVCVFLIFRLMKTSYGRAFKAIRDDEIAAESMGISLFKHKMISFVLSAFLAGISGGLLASVVGVITPVYFRFTLAYEILLIVVLGGQGSISGTVIAATVITIGKEWLRFLDEEINIGGITIQSVAGMRMLVFSALLMCVILFWPEGLMGTRECSWEGILMFPQKIVKKLKQGLQRKRIGGDAS